MGQRKAIDAIDRRGKARSRQGIPHLASCPPGVSIELGGFAGPDPGRWLVIVVLALLAFA